MTKASKKEKGKGKQDMKKHKKLNQNAKLMSSMNQKAPVLEDGKSMEPS